MAENDETTITEKMPPMIPQMGIRMIPDNTQAVREIIDEIIKNLVF